MVEELLEKENKQKVTSLIKGLLKRKKLLVVILVIIGGILVWRYYAQRNGNDVDTTEVKRGTVREELIFSGSIQAGEHARLPFLSSGELDWVGVSEGDEVKRGQVLARLNTTNLYHTLQSAEADLRRYQATLDRVYDEVEGHDEDESLEQREDRTVAEANKDKAYRAYAIAQKNLANVSLKAPFDGIVSSITNPFTGIGTLYSESQIEIVNPETVYFDVSADQSEVVDLFEGQKVNVVLDSFPDEEFEGEIIFISLAPLGGESGAVYKVKVGFKNGGFNLSKSRIGMTGDAKFVLSQKEDVLYLPPKFVNSDAKGKFVNKGRKNNKVYVEVGVEGEERIEIKGDIEEGDVVFD